MALRTARWPAWCRAARLAFALGLGAGVACAGGIAAPAVAQQVVGIMAIVNDQAITAYDVQQRLNLIIRSSSLPDTPAVRRELAPRVLEALIEEVLQLQEAKRLNIRVSQKEIDAALALIERQNRIPPGGLDPFLKERGIDRRTLLQQVEAGLAWNDIVRQRFLRTVTVTDEEVDRAMERIKETADATRLLVAEIFIAVDTPRDEENARRNAASIFEELRKGGSFPQLARQFSQAASAERGGDLGWVLAAELEPEVQRVVAQLPTNSVTEPIRTAGGFRIVALRDRRDPSRGAGDTVLSLRQVVLGGAGSRNPNDIEAQRALAETIRGTVRGCEDFLSVTKELGAGMSGDLGRVKLSELPQDLQGALANLPVGTPSEPVASEEGLRILMVCDRQTPEIALPRRDEVHQRLVIQRLEVRARRHLRDLRDAAFLDIRAS